MNFVEACVKSQQDGYEYTNGLIRVKTKGLIMFAFKDSSAWFGIISATQIRNYCQGEFRVVAFEYK